MTPNITWQQWHMKTTNSAVKLKEGFHDSAHVHEPKYCAHCSYNPGQNSLGHLRKLPLLVQFFKVRWHYLFFKTPLPLKSMLTDWCESQWFEINIDLGVWGGGGEDKVHFPAKQ